MKKLITIDRNGLETEASSEHVEQLTQCLIRFDLADFAGNLEIARQMFRKWPDLVQAPEFPEPYCAAFVGRHGFEPNDAGWISCCGCDDDPTATDYRDRSEMQARKQARDTVRQRDAQADPRMSKPLATRWVC